MKSFFSTARKIDLYGMTMSLNVKGFGSHNTWLGIILSLAHIVIISTYGFSRFMQMFNKENPETSMNELYYNLDNEPPFNATDINFDLAFTIFRIIEGAPPNPIGGN